MKVAGWILIIGGLGVAESDAWHPVPYVSAQGLGSTALIVVGLCLLIAGIGRAAGRRTGT